MPLEATHHTAAGAKAFAMFFVRVIDWGGATVSSNYMRHYTFQGCSTCAPGLSGVDRDRVAGRRYVGGRFTVQSAHLYSKPLETKADYTALVVFDISAFKEFSKTGRLIESEPRQVDEQFEVSLRWETGSWQTIDLRLSR